MLFYKAYNNRLTCLHPTTAFLELKIYTSNWKCTQMWYLAHFWWQKVHAHICHHSDSGIMVLCNIHNTVFRERGHTRYVDACDCLRWTCTSPRINHVELQRRGTGFPQPAHGTTTSTHQRSFPALSLLTDMLHYTRSNCHIMKMHTTASLTSENSSCCQWFSKSMDL